MTNMHTPQPMLPNIRWAPYLSCTDSLVKPCQIWCAKSSQIRPSSIREHLRKKVYFRACQIREGWRSPCLIGKLPEWGVRGVESYAPKYILFRRCSLTASSKGVKRTNSITNSCATHQKSAVNIHKSWHFDKKRKAKTCFSPRDWITAESAKAIAGEAKNSPIMTSKSTRKNTWKSESIFLFLLLRTVFFSPFPLRSVQRPRCWRRGSPTPFSCRSSSPCRRRPSLMDLFQPEYTTGKSCLIFSWIKV